MIDSTRFSILVGCCIVALFLLVSILINVFQNQHRLEALERGMMEQSEIFANIEGHVVRFDDSFIHIGEELTMKRGH